MAKNRALALAASVALLAGCAESTVSTEPGITAPAGTTPEITAPAKRPSNPTDEFRQTDVVIGTVTRGGTGPCYGLSTDDGVQYAVYEAKGRELSKGTRIRVETLPARVRIDCGAGKLVEVNTLSVVR